MAHTEMDTKAKVIPAPHHGFIEEKRSSLDSGSPVDQANCWIGSRPLLSHRECSSAIT